MKKQIYIITILFLLLNTFFMIAQTQEEELKNNSWYVHKVTLGDIDYISPDNEERSVSVPNLKFSDNPLEGYFETFFCFYYTSDHLLFLENQQFTVGGWISLAIVPSACSIQENSDFDFYYSSMMNVFEATGPYIFSYEVNIIDGSTKQLIITNQNGDKAYFNNYYLSNPLFELEGVNVYPNPASDILQITLPDTAKERYDYKIYDLNGKLIKIFKDKTGKQITLDIQDLNLGVYWLEINNHDSNQRGLVTKIIKK